MSNIEFIFETPAALLLAVPCALILLWAYRRWRGAQAQRSERRALVLRMLAVILLCVIAAGFGVVTYASDASTVVLVDASESMTSVTQKAQTMAQQALDAAKDGNAVQVIAFAGAPEQGGAPLDAGATDIAAALNAAGAALGQAANRRVVLISDGCATDGDASAAAEALARQGVRLDALYLDTALSLPEAQLSAFSMPADAAQGQRISALVTVTANAPMQGMLRIFDGETPVYEAPAQVIEGVNTLTAGLTAAEAGAHVYRAEYAPDGDAIAQNNSLYALMNVRESVRILLVDGTGSEAQQLSRLLEQGGFSVDTVQAGAMPDTLSALCEYGLIVLMNVSANDLPEGSAEHLERYVSEYGRSVLTAGGENTYIYGGMKDTPFEAFLPVTMSVAEKESADPVALMLVIDVTDSMTRQSMGTPIEMARRGAIKCVDALNSNDYAGVITFSDEAEVLVEMSPMSSKDGIMAAINGIETASPDKLTKFTDALETACDTLAAFDALERKHVIFITDGSPADGKQGFDGVVGRMRANGITMSTICVGRIMNVVKLLEGLSSLGGGRCYFVESARDLPDIMSTDTVLSQVEYTITDPVLPRPGARVFAIGDESALTQLYGYIRTGAKGAASVALSTPEGRPLYAQWDYGQGRAASFMSDLSGVWSYSWFSSEGGRALITSMIKELIPDMLSQAAVDVRLQTGGARGYLCVPDAAGGAARVRAEITRPDGKTCTVMLEKTAEGDFAGETPMCGAGCYSVSLAWLDEAGETLLTHEAAAAGGWSSEYDALARADGQHMLMELASGTGGAVLGSMDELLEIPLQAVPVRHDAALPLAVCAAACILADTLLRRTKRRRDGAGGNHAGSVK